MKSPTKTIEEIPDETKIYKLLEKHMDIGVAVRLSRVIVEWHNAEIVKELKQLKTKKVKGAGLLEMKWIDDRIKELSKKEGE